MTRKQKRKLIVIVVLLLLLAVLGSYYAYYRTTQRLTFDVATVTDDTMDAPVYLYSFSGDDVERLQRPVGVLVDGQSIYVVDSARHTVVVFDEDGKRLRSFGASETTVPLYIAKNPKDGNLYISDRRARTIHKFKTDGTYLGEFDPEFPADQLPTEETQGYVWAPVAIAFAPDGTMYVTELLKGHRLVVFGPDGAFKRSVGTAGLVTTADAGEELFQFPNGLTFHDGSLYVADSNNRRVQVFDKDGVFDRIVVTQGLPRGIDFLAPFPSDEPSASARYVIVDTLAHDGTVWSTGDTKLVSFGEQGVLEGQFSYPNSVSVMQRNNKIFITDTANGRIQVWGWPSEVSPVPIAQVAQYWRWCFAPLVFLPLLLVLRKKRFFSTQEFVEVMLAAEDVATMPSRRRAWAVSQETYEALKGYEQGDVDLGELLAPTDFSESDTRALMEKYEIGFEMAKTLTMARRAHVFTTEDDELRRLARVLEIDVVNRVEFLERFARKGTDGTPGAPDSE